MRLLLEEESLRPRACVQLKDDALTKVLPVEAGTCHLPSSPGAGCAAVTGRFTGAMSPAPWGWVAPARQVPARRQRSTALARHSSQGSLPLTHSQRFQTSDSTIPVRFMAQRTLEELISMQNVLLRKRNSPVGTPESQLVQ